MKDTRCRGGGALGSLISHGASRAQSAAPPSPRRAGGQRRLGGTRFAQHRTATLAQSFPRVSAVHPSNEEQHFMTASLGRRRRKGRCTHRPADGPARTALPPALGGRGRRLRPASLEMRNRLGMISPFLK